ncbi:MAG: anaerobic ribonucleoside-triphosphate reductase activating protein [Chloroflexi bacterium]|nr:anaerobic ribonucleoside-triphosphate reductase activating protein [Chloroflexota bacterium]
MKIVGLQKVTLIDYPGHIAASVFLGGCNLDCGFCHNRWMIREEAVAAALSVEELLAWLETRVGRLGGVCLSGGEPTLHAEVVDLARRIKGLGYELKLDTNGLLPGRLAALLSAGLLDYVAVDLKAPLNPVSYERITRRKVDLAALRLSMNLLREGDVAYEFRTTVCPGLAEADLRAIARELLPGERWYLQPFVPAETVDPAVRGERALTEEELSHLATELGAALRSAA